MVSPISRAQEVKNKSVAQTRMMHLFIPASIPEGYPQPEHDTAWGKEYQDDQPSKGNFHFRRPQKTLGGSVGERNLVASDRRRRSQWPGCYAPPRETATTNFKS
jgi:hypothetical protein